MEIVMTWSLPYAICLKQGGHDRRSKSVTMSQKRWMPTFLLRYSNAASHAKSQINHLQAHWYIRKAVEWLEASGVVDKARLIRLEFDLFPALSDGPEDEYGRGALCGDYVRSRDLH